MKLTCFIALIVVVANDRAHGDPTHQLIVKELKVTADPADPYFGPWSAEIVSSDTLTIKTPFKADPPPETLMKVKVSLDGDDLPEVEDRLCNLLKDLIVGRDIVNSGTPKGQFPKHCPIKAGADYAVVNYKLPAMKIPPGFHGEFGCVVTFYVPGKNPSVVITASGTLRLKLPSLPKIG